MADYHLTLTAAEIDNKLSNALLHSSQTLTDEQKTQARTNIGAISASDTYSRNAIDNMFGAYVNDIAELIGGEA